MARYMMVRDLQLRHLLRATVAKHHVGQTYQIPFEPP
jgi:hypothetical protein